MGYYTLVSHKHKFIFFWNAKCGCSAIKRLFLEIERDEVYEGPKTIHDPPNVHAYLGYLNSHSYFLPKEDLEKYSDYKKILIVRDPWSRVVSYYCDKIVIKREEMALDKTFGLISLSSTNFMDFVRLLYLVNPIHFQHHLEEQGEGLEDVEFDHVVELKDMNDALNPILEELGVTHHLRTLERFGNLTPYKDGHGLAHKSYVGDVKPQCLNPHKLPKKENFYSKDSWKMVEEIYEKDLSRWPFLKKDFST